jgi:hypothetical protein
VTSPEEQPGTLFRGERQAQIVPLMMLMKRVAGGDDFEDRRGAVRGADDVEAIPDAVRALFPADGQSNRSRKTRTYNRHPGHHAGALTTGNVEFMPCLGLTSALSRGVRYGYSHADQQQTISLQQKGITMKHRAKSGNSARAIVAGGMMAAGAAALIGATPATAKPTPPPHPGNNVLPATNPNGNPNKPPKLSGFSGFVPVWATGTYNTLTCPNGTCFNPDSTSPFPTGSSPSKSNPIVANSSGTSLAIGLADL